MTDPPTVARKIRRPGGGRRRLSRVRDEPMAEPDINAILGGIRSRSPWHTISCAD